MIDLEIAVIERACRFFEQSFEAWKFDILMSPDYQIAKQIEILAIKIRIVFHAVFQALPQQRPAF